VSGPFTGLESGLVDQVLERRHDSDDLAVVDLATGDQATYRVLARRVQVLTDLLARHGVGRRATVAMVMDKSVDAVACMWATLRLGARYVPVDESLPPARVALLLEKSRPAVTVVHPGYRDTATGAPAGTVITANRAAQADAGPGPLWNPAAEAGYRPPGRVDRHPDDDAYVIFTSGSTGGPKGVMISHRSVCSLLDGVQRVVGFEPGLRYLNVAPLFFDASVVDLYSTFLVGGTVHLLPRLTMPTQVTRACQDYRITDTLLVPSVIRMLVSRFSDIRRRDLSALRRVWFGGESCPVTLLRSLSEAVPGLSFVHGYGPTETTHSATLYLTADLTAEHDEYLPIGTPLPHVSVLVADDDLRPVPGGEIGELLIGGPQVMAGYCGDAERTREVLVNPPGGGSYYRSGDFVRQRPDGQLVFVGRRDDAVKVGGNLVHLSEVEAAALSVPGVGDCCAVLVEQPVTGRSITLFVLGGPGQPAAAGALRDELARLLPGYMLPSRIIEVPEQSVELTPSGKLDRSRLSGLGLPTPADRP
jgi:amino acid adenylation domain-containing protein